MDTFLAGAFLVVKIGVAFLGVYIVLNIIRKILA